MTNLYFAPRYRQQDVVVYIPCTPTGESDKALKFRLNNGKTMWLPKAAVSIPATGPFKDSQVIARWFNFDERTATRIGLDDVIRTQGVY